MIRLEMQFADRTRPEILCLGAHSDDLEIGSGATILQLAIRYPSARIHWVVFSGVGARKDEAEQSARYFTGGFAASTIDVHAFRDGHFPYEGVDIKAVFESLKQRTNPDVVFTHLRDDRHQDHRLISDFAWQTFRNHFILEYEIPKYDGDFGSPSHFVAVTDACKDAKLDALERYFCTQRDKSWFTRETFVAAMRIRGIECRSVSGYAEAFYCRKTVLDL